MLDQDTTATEVAHALGYADYAHFGRQFVRYIGTTPRAFLEGVSAGTNGAALVSP